MHAEEYLQAGKLDECLAQLQAQVRTSPAVAKHRVFLFQLLAVLGQWDRALNQLNVAAGLDVGTLAMVQTYKEVLRCEVLRAEVFAGLRTPLVFGQPEPWIAYLIEALRLSAGGEYVQSQQQRQLAFEQAPVTSGSVDGKAFAWIADADSRLGPVLEAIVNGRYYWIPFQQIHSILIEKPVDLRDLVWVPAHFIWVNGGESVGIIPSRYPGSQDSADDAIRLARKTQWQTCEADTFLGSGQRVLVSDVEEYPLLDVRSISLNTVQAQNQPAKTTATHSEPARDG